jgi:hypothetical protein
MAAIWERRRSGVMHRPDNLSAHDHGALIQVVDYSSIFCGKRN